MILQGFLKFTRRVATGDKRAATAGLNSFWVSFEQLLTDGLDKLHVLELKLETFDG